MMEKNIPEAAMIFDTHAHYDCEGFDADRHEVLSSLPEAGIGYVIDPGCDGASSKAAVAISEQYDYIYAAVGWHPEEWESWDGGSMALLRQLAVHPRVVAIGEIGLDYYRDKEHKALQQEMFERQILLALELNLPVIIHDREAHEDSLEMVLRYPALRGTFHCYSGSAEMAKELLKRGWYLGFDGPITYKNNKKAAEVLSVTPLDRILVETDSPYMAPVPCRGKRNDSRLLPHILAKVAEEKSITPEAAEHITAENARRLFGI